MPPVMPRHPPLAATLAIAAALVLGASAPGRAQTTARCDSLGGQTPMNACYVQVADSADLRLRHLLDELRRSLPPAEFARLQETQTLWQRYRDGQCRWERSFVEGGTIAPMMAATCRIVLTWNRVAELRQYLCEGGPLESPCAASRRYGDDAPFAVRTTYVIVHGAWGGSWDWRTVDSLLTAAGHRVYRASLTGLGERVHLASPGVGLATHIADVVNLIVWEDLQDVVLVGHSYGGMVITGVADQVPGRIQRAVYVDAVLPDSGETMLGLMNPDFVAMVRANTEGGFVRAAWEPADRPAPRDVPQPLRTFTDTLGLRRAHTFPVPAAYVLTVEPGRLPDDYQPFADRAATRGWDVHRLTADHVPERSAPRALVELLLGIR